MGPLTHNDIPTGVLYGFLRDLTTFMEQFNTDNVVFCFDCGQGLREIAMPGYKSGRRERRLAYTPEEKLNHATLTKQIHALPDILKSIGYAHVYEAQGYEADDLLSTISGSIGKGDNATLISADADLWQCLAHNVCWHNPTTYRTVTAATFRAEWCIDPDQWADVKALAGCDSDDVEGIPGVGEKTAAKFLRGELKHTTKAHKKIRSPRGQKVWRDNLKLVKLPYPGTPAIVPQPGLDTVTPAKWAAVADKYGLASLRHAPATARRPMRRGFVKG